MPESTRNQAKYPLPRLRIDPIACEGIGICAHLAADLIRIDPWGYPIVTPEPLHHDDKRHARAAVVACPRRALFIAGDSP